MREKADVASPEAPLRLSCSETLASDVDGYPAGAWRLSSFDELDRVVLWVSHILIRHAQSTDEIAVFRPDGWRPDGKPPKRSRDEAKRLALCIAGHLALHPHDFGRMATAYSEDLATRERGGSLGGERASQVAGSLLDALEQMKAGGVARVVETPAGFHILKRGVRPPEQLVAGQRLLIRYDGVAADEFMGKANRTREQALAQAWKLRQSAETTPFSALVRAHSESSDRARDGDMGVWSTIAPTGNGAELEALAALQVGEISQPLDSSSGVQLLKRVEVEPRDTYAILSLRLGYDPRDEGSKAQARVQAADLAARLREDPTLFDSLREQHCCRESEEWNQGTRDEALEAVVRSLQVGQIAPHPVDLSWCYLIPKRVTPRSEKEELSYEAPKRTEPDVEAIVRNSNPKGLISETKLMRTDARQALQLPKGAQAQLDDALAQLENAYATARSPDERVAARLETFRLLRNTLGAENYRAFEKFRREWVRARVMALSPR